jgi:hypothetical protein
MSVLPLRRENYFVSIGAYAHPISQPSDRHRKAEIEPRHPNLEVTWLNLSPAMPIRELRVHHVIEWAYIYAPMLIKFTLPSVVYLRLLMVMATHRRRREQGSEATGGGRTQDELPRGNGAPARPPVGDRAGG